MNEQRLKIGMSIVTTRDAEDQDWHTASRVGVRWGVRGIVVAVHTDGDAVIYDVQHEDGTRYPYSAAEVDNVSPEAVDEDDDAQKRAEYRDGSLRELLRKAGMDMTDDAILVGVRSVVADRQLLMDANADLAAEVRRLWPFEAEARVLREQLEYMRDLVKTAIVQAGLAEQAREYAVPPAPMKRVFTSDGDCVVDGPTEIISTGGGGGEPSDRPATGGPGPEAT